MKRNRKRPAHPSPDCRRVYEMLLAAHGHRGWWPGRTRFEMCVGAILTQNVAWGNVRKALANLRRLRALSVKGLHALPEAALAEAIRPARYANQKARYLKGFTAHLMAEYDGQLARLFRQPTDALQRELLSLKGFGPETADCLLVYGQHAPIMVIDAYTRRIAARLGWTSPDAGYADVQDFFHAALPGANADMLGDYHAQLVALGHHHCHPKPACGTCPLREVCPTGLADMAG